MVAHDGHLPRPGCVACQCKAYLSKPGCGWLQMDMQCHDPHYSEAANAADAKAKEENDKTVA